MPFIIENPKTHHLELIGFSTEVNFGRFLMSSVWLRMSEILPVVLTITLFQGQLMLTRMINAGKMKLLSCSCGEVNPISCKWSDALVFPSPGGHWILFE